MAARFFFDYFSYLSDTAGQMPDIDEGKGDASKKAEARLNDLEAEALAAYMRDRFLKNRSEVFRSALGQFLVREGYLPGGDSKTADDTSGQATPEAPRTPVRYSKGRKK